MHPARLDNLNFCGRPIGREELDLIGSVTSDCSGLSRTELASTICEILDWRRPNGRLKTVECRALLEELEGRSLLRLPAARAGRPRGSRTSVLCAHIDEISLSGKKSEFDPLEIVPVQNGEENARWRAMVDRHHYLGHRVPFGAHLRYFINLHAPAPVTVGCLQFSSPAWRMGARDRFIGWDETARKRNLQLIVSNSRFLILPSVRIKNLASSALSKAASRLPSDWESRYGVRPVMLETLVDQDRYSGTCYRAANWLEVGMTSGRGRNDAAHRRHGESPKIAFTFPLVKDAIARLKEVQHG